MDENQSESLFPCDSLDNPSDSQDELCPNESDNQLSSESQSDSGEEVWEESDESCAEECPELPSASASQDSVEENAIVQWLLIFFLRLQAKHYIPDAAVQCLVKFLYIFLCILGRYFTTIANIASKFPPSLYLLRKHLNLKQDFKRLVVCRKCNSVYSLQECIDESGTIPVARACFYRRNTHRSVRCGTPLLKTVELSSGKKILRPYKVYCYHGLKNALQRLLLLPGFMDLCDKWRSDMCSEEGVMKDIYDGRIWKEFLYHKGKPFLLDRFTFFLAMNVDWFKPHKHTEASVGAIYLTVMNFPYYARFKRENLLLVSIIPGPHEPKRDINSFLQPLVSELIDFFKGVDMSVRGYNDLQKVRCALLCVASDLPAARKVCGFVGHSARLGCSRCKKEFPGGFGEPKNYSGFEREDWPPRNVVDHRADVKKIQKERTITERQRLESLYGCRYSALLDLSYFDPVRMTIIDPMHNLFLGTAKHVVKDTLISKGLIQDKHTTQIQETMNSMKTPQTVGRIPHKIASGFAAFTADQFKNWVTLYSIPCLKQILPDDHLECWRHFVLACRILCRHQLTKEDVTLADALLLHFCKRFERMNGEYSITPNMHMHCHLKDVLLDYGPVYSFWCFSYERYNGILETQPTNNKDIETQLMQRFLCDNNCFAMFQPDLFNREFASVSICATSSRLTGSACTSNDSTIHKG